MKTHSLTLLFALFMLAGTGVAQAERGKAAFGITGGTLGVGGQLTFGLGSALNLRALIAGIEYDDDFEPDDSDGDSGNDLDYNGDAKLFNAGLILDLHPFRGGFRFSAGLMYTNNRFEGEAVCQSDSLLGCEVGGVPAAVANGDRVTGDVVFKGAAPYLGLGWGNAVEADQKFTLSVDLGVMFTGEPDASVRCQQSPQLLAVRLANCQQAAEQEERELENDLDDLELWPVLMIGAAYKF